MSDGKQVSTDTALPKPDEVKRDIRSTASEIQTKEEVFIEHFTRVSVRSERQYVHSKGASRPLRSQEHVVVFHNVSYVFND
jgi:hypothetical protein